MLVAKDEAPTELARDIALQVYLLGMVDFEAARQLQRRLHFDISGQREQAALIVCEHFPLITVGRQGSRAHIHFEPEELRARRWPIRWVNRGGGCMLHLPGQLALHPIFPLDRLGLSVTGYVQQLATALRDTVSEFHLSRPAQIVPGGIRVGPRLLASLGVAVRDWVSYYGAYLNIQPCLDLYRRVVCDPTGGESMTSLERERKGKVRPALVRERLIEHVQTRFGFGRVSLFSDHPALQGHTQRCQPTAEFSAPGA